MNADFRGMDKQLDTYFNVPEGRLKLREGNIENSLIFYNRKNLSGPRRSDIALCKVPRGLELRQVLSNALGVKVAVRKRREIYFVGNVKFHIDTVSGLGSFVEIEAIDMDGSAGTRKLRAQCDKYMRLLGIRREDLLSGSYSDMLRAK
jgi:predicted adenylyl cyclase CyaB